MATEKSDEIRARYDSLDTLEIGGDSCCQLCGDSTAKVARPYPAHKSCLGEVLNLTEAEIQMLHNPSYGDENQLELVLNVLSLFEEDGPTKGQIETFLTEN